LAGNMQKNVITISVVVVLADAVVFNRSLSK